MNCKIKLGSKSENFFERTGEDAEISRIIKFSTSDNAILAF